MSIWILPAVLVAGIAALIGLALYVTHGLDDQGEPLEYRHDHD